jgi:tRNA(Ile)-lysidine synthase
MNNSGVHIPSHLLPKKGKTIYLAISGGVDSVVLLDLLVKAKYTVHLLHVNYHLRGEDSNLDENLVRQFANCHQTKISVLDFDMKAHLQNGGNLQNEARKIRYSFFNEHVTENDILMTAHHFDDQMETFFMHLSRKSGIVGMSCMAEKNKNHWRPLLPFRKKELYAYAKEKHLEYREDVSNADNKYLRNKWRNEWIPLMEKSSPHLGKNIAVLVKAIQNERAELEKKYQNLLEEIQLLNRWTFDSYDATCGEGKYLIGKSLGLRPSEVERLNTLRLSEKSKNFSVERDDLIIWNDGNAFVWQLNELHLIPELELTEIEALPSDFDKTSYYADADKISGSLKIRRWEEGDRIAPIGMKGTQLISDIIKDAKIASNEKMNVLVVEDDEKIIWCVGLKIGRLVLAGKETLRIVRISVKN